MSQQSEGVLGLREFYEITISDSTGRWVFRCLKCPRRFSMPVGNLSPANIKLLFSHGISHAKPKRRSA